MWLLMVCFMMSTISVVVAGYAFEAEVAEGIVEPVELSMCRGCPRR